MASSEAKNEMFVQVTSVIGHAAGTTHTLARRFLGVETVCRPKAGADSDPRRTLPDLSLLSEKHVTRHQASLLLSTDYFRRSFQKSLQELVSSRR